MSAKKKNSNPKMMWNAEPPAWQAMIGCESGFVVARGIRIIFRRGTNDPTVSFSSQRHHRNRYVCRYNTQIKR